MKSRSVSDERNPRADGREHIRTTEQRIKSDLSLKRRFRRPFRVIVVSPHSDDAALSISGFLERCPRSWKVLLLTLTGGDIETESAWRVRLNEDRLFAKVVGANYEACSIPDARVALPLTPVLSTPTSCRVAAFVRVLQSVILRVDPHLVLLPLGAGGHSDHLASCEAGLMVLLSGSIQERTSILLYEDLPYAAMQPGCVHHRVDALIGRGTAVVSHTVEISQHQALRVVAASIYRSQQLHRWSAMIRQYLESRGGAGAVECFWEVVLPGRVPFQHQVLRSLVPVRG